MLYQQESVSAMFQINAGRGEHSHQRCGAPRSHTAPSSVLLMAPSLACLEKVVLTMHHRDSWAWLMGSSIGAIPPSSCCNETSEEAKLSPATSTREWEKQRVILLIDHSSWAATSEGKNETRWGMMPLQSTLSIRMLGSPQGSDTPLFS